MGDKEEIIRVLRDEANRQRGIFNKHAPQAIHPDCSDEIKSAFNKADRRIKELDKEIARLITGGEPYEPTIFDKMFDYIDKLTGDDEPKDSVTTGVRG